MSEAATPPVPAAPAQQPAVQPQLSPAAQSRLQELLNREEAVRKAEGEHKAREAEQTAAKTKTPKNAAPASGDETLHAEVAELRAWRKEQEDRRVLEEARSEVRTKLNAEEYPVIAQMGAYDYVLQKIIDHARNTGEVISESEAAKRVEAEIEEFVTKASPHVEARRKGRKAAPVEPEAETPTLSRSMTAEAPRRTVRAGFDPRQREEMLDELLR